jgi:putative iron-dependent peroxidase
MTAVPSPQPAILLPPPLVARHLEFEVKPGASRADVESVLRSLMENGRIDGNAAVLGIGASLATLLGHAVPGLREFPVLAGAPVAVPSTPRALWIWLRGDDRGEVLLRSRSIERVLAPALVPASIIDAFRYDIGRDLTGYEDGTENPKAGAATDAAIVPGGPASAPPGSSFVAVQVWQHDLARFSALAKEKQDSLIGRERISNDEIDDAPPSAHVKRTAQESFEPPSFVVRRSMPWSDATRDGLVFVAFGATLDKYERQMRRMAGLDDGIVDGVFAYSTPLSGAYYWCPPVVRGRVTLGGL